MWQGDAQDLAPCAIADSIGAGVQGDARGEQGEIGRHARASAPERCAAGVTPFEDEPNGSTRPRASGMDADVSAAPPVLRWGLKAPRAIYHAHLGWLLGHRFLLLTHRGRRSGLSRRTMLEVLRWDDRSREAIVMSGFGPGAQWLRNVDAGGGAEIQIGRERWSARMRRLATEEAVAVLADYERRNRLIAPLVRAVLSHLSGERHDGTDAARRRIVSALPLIAFRPR